MDKCTYTVKTRRQECARNRDKGRWDCEEKKDLGYSKCSERKEARRKKCDSGSRWFSLICISWLSVTFTCCVLWTRIRNIACVSWVMLKNGACVFWAEARRFFCYIAQLFCSMRHPQQDMPTPRPGKNYVTNLVDGPYVLQRLLEDIRNASRTIHISMLLFFNDKAGNAVADALLERARNNVEVRVIFDFIFTKAGHLPDFGTAEDADALANKMRAGGITVIDSRIDYDHIVELTESTSKYKTENKVVGCNTRADVDNADHRKLILIDNDIGYTGSANIGDEYFYTVPFTPTIDSEEWHDGLARFQGPIVGVMEEFFKRRWILDGGSDYEIESPVYPEDTIDTSMQVFTATPGFKNDIRKLFVQQIRKATSSIFIENPYMFHPIIIDELISAKQRRPELVVTLIVPNAKKNDHGPGQDAQEHRYKSLLQAGIKIYEYQNHFNHLKLATFDCLYTIIGSANLNYRSLEDDRDFELVVLVEDKALGLEIAGECDQPEHINVREHDIRFSKQIQESDLDFRTITRSPATLVLEAMREI